MNDSGVGSKNTTNDGGRSKPSTPGSKSGKSKSPARLVTSTHKLPTKKKSPHRRIKKTTSLKMRNSKSAQLKRQQSLEKYMQKVNEKYEKYLKESEAIEGNTEEILKIVDYLKDIIASLPRAEKRYKMLQLEPWWLEIEEMRDQAVHLQDQLSKFRSFLKNLEKQRDELIRISNNLPREFQNQEIPEVPPLPSIRIPSQFNIPRFKSIGEILESSSITSDDSFSFDSSRNLFFGPIAYSSPKSEQGFSQVEGNGNIFGFDEDDSYADFAGKSQMTKLFGINNLSPHRLAKRHFHKTPPFQVVKEWRNETETKDAPTNSSKMETTFDMAERRFLELLKPSEPSSNNENRVKNVSPVSLLDLSAIKSDTTQIFGSPTAKSPKQPTPFSLSALKSDTTQVYGSPRTKSPRISSSFNISGLKTDETQHFDSPKNKSPQTSHRESQNDEENHVHFDNPNLDEIFAPPAPPRVSNSNPFDNEENPNNFNEFENIFENPSNPVINNQSHEGSQRSRENSQRTNGNGNIFENHDGSQENPNNINELDNLFGNQEVPVNNENPNGSQPSRQNSQRMNNSSIRDPNLPLRTYLSNFMEFRAKLASVLRPQKARTMEVLMYYDILTEDLRKCVNAEKNFTIMKIDAKNALCSDKGETFKENHLLLFQIADKKLSDLAERKFMILTFMRVIYGDINRYRIPNLNHVRNEFRTILQQYREDFR